MLRATAACRPGPTIPRSSDVLRPLATAAWPLFPGVPSSSEHRFHGVVSTVRRLLRAARRPVMTELPSEFRDRPPVSAKTLGSIRQRLVARLAPEILNPFDRTPEREATLRAAIGDILADPELDLAVDAGDGRRGRGGRLRAGTGSSRSSTTPRSRTSSSTRPTRSSPSGRAASRRPTIVLGSADELVEIAQRIAALAGRELSVAHPIVDARMPDGVAGQRGHPAGRRAVPRDPQVQPPPARPRARRPRTAATG